MGDLNKKNSIFKLFLIMFLFFKLKRIFEWGCPIRIFDCLIEYSNVRMFVAIPSLYVREMYVRTRYTDLVKHVSK